MASACFRVPLTLSIPQTSTSPKTNPNTKRCALKTRCVSSNARFPTPPLNPNDPFLAKLASAAAACPEKILESPKSSDSLPYLDLFESPQLMAAPAQVERTASYNEHRSRRPPPDLPSLLLHGRIVFIGMPLVPAVTELIVAQLMYLQWMDPKEPIYLYISSTGTSREDGETVALETEGFAIYDALMQMKNEIRTLCLSVAMGQACLLLAAGTKGKRYMMPHSIAMIQQPRVPSAGLMPADDVLIRAKEAITNRDTLIELLAKHTGNSVEKVTKTMRKPFYMDATRAKAFGVIDKILRRGQEDIMADVASPEEWDKISGIGSVDGI